MPSTTATTPTPLEERELMARTAAAIWASIGVFGLLATIEPLRSNTEHVADMRLLGAVAGIAATGLLVVPARHLPQRLFSAMVPLMILCIAGLAYAGGVPRGDLTILFTFAVVFSAYFFSLRTSVIHLGLIVLLLVSRLFLVDDTGGSTEAVRFGILLPALTSVWGLVSVLRRELVDREARLKVQEVYDPETGVFSVSGLDQVLDAELARAARHGRLLSLIHLDVTGPQFADCDAKTRLRVATAIARALVGRIRVEDRAARLGDLRFAVLAVETGENGAAVLGRNLAEQVRKRLLSIGYEGSDFTVAVGWADYQHADGSKLSLVSMADTSLAAAMPDEEGISLPSARRRPSLAVTHPEPAR